MITDDALAKELREHINILEQTCLTCAPVITEITKVIIQCFQHRNKLILCGNGGSAADAQHIAAEFVNRFRFDRPALPALALTTDTSILTSISNDSGFENVFSRQIEALAQPGDILAGISTSGRSSNILRALEVARAQKIITIGFTGINGVTYMQPVCNYVLTVPSDRTARIQEAHEFVWHCICGTVESELFSRLEPPENKQ